MHEQSKPSSFRPAVLIGSLFAVGAVVFYAGITVQANTAHCAQLSAQYTEALSGKVYNQVDAARARVAYTHACDPGSAASADQQLAFWQANYHQST